MKQNILIALLVFLSLNSYAQEEAIQTGSTTENYELKSKNQKDAAWILLGVGTVCTVGGVFMMNNDKTNDNKNFGFGTNFDSKAALFLGGLVIAASSIPFFIASRKNKTKEMKSGNTSAGIKIETMDKHIFFKETAAYPSVSFCIRL